ncbi:MAG: hypothetical protein HY900_25940 [Deltaproteobacteria bacterium]|nr:hypothetical protein [Deltaproteobacteria bacterium]
MIARASIPLFLILTVGAATALSAGYPLLQAKIVPMLVGGTLLLLCLVQLLGELAGKRPARTGEREGEPAARALLREGLWLVGFCAAIYLLGFLTGLAGYSAGYARARGAGWGPALGLGASLAVLCYVLLIRLMQTDLYPGLLPRALGWG